MSRHGTILDTSTPAVRQEVDALTRSWHEGAFAPNANPRSVWLRYVEIMLSHHYPQSSSRDRNVTARSLAPFPLTEKP